MQQTVMSYCDVEKKSQNPFQLTYLGSERDETIHQQLTIHDIFIAIGSNLLRQQIDQYLTKHIKYVPIRAVHTSAVIGTKVQIGAGTVIAPNATVNALATVGRGVICNTACVIEHECQISDFVHIAPGAVLAGNVQVGKGTFVGANSVIKEGVRIGYNVTIGAGSVILKDVPDNTVIVGNPAKKIRTT
jgi:acetyltransferase EpsM